MISGDTRCPDMAMERGGPAGRSWVMDSGTKVCTLEGGAGAHCVERER